MIEINIDANINNINYLRFMEETEQHKDKNGENQSYSWKKRELPIPENNKK